MKGKSNVTGPFETGGVACHARPQDKYGSGGRKREQAIGLGKSLDWVFSKKAKAGQGGQFRNG